VVVDFGRDLRAEGRVADVPVASGAHRATVKRVVNVVERLLDFREEQVADGMALIDLYNTRREPGKNLLRELHDELDQAVAAAYGFTAEDEPRAQLLALNASVAAEEAGGLTPRDPGNAGLVGTMRTAYRIEPQLKLPKPASAAASSRFTRSPSR
jgi:hypothetical protein